MAAKGFGAWDPAQHTAAASKGGRTAHVQGSAHQFTREQARIAGAKGGAMMAARPGHMSKIGKLGGKAVATDRAHMAAIGAKGGKATRRTAGDGNG